MPQLSFEVDLQLRGALGYLSAPGSLRWESWELLRTQALRQSVHLLFEYASFERTPLETEDLRMLESIVELTGGLLLSAMMVLIGSCIVGSIVAALRAVSGGS